ncbi:protein neprosin-like [Tasmannia lanceolata]|uniref:protein neprosin-like n=1 Tax=Tasmannia lanceolata TaxID=3420 RepID=UPI004062E0AC
MINKEATSVRISVEIGLKDGGCPQGTVPIRRIQKQDLINSKSLKTIRNRYSSKVVSPQYRLALQSMRIGEYYGTKATLNRWRPQVSDRQYTATNIWMGDPLGNIQIGFVVNPTLYNDSYTHLHSYWTANGFHNTGCDDVLCPGFVQVSKSLPLGMVLKTSCEYNGTQIDDDFTVFKDPESKDWWLLLGPNRRIGYWPKNLFHSEFADYAKTVQWGGEVFNAGTEAWPPMGSGRFPDEGYTKASYIGNIQLIDRDGKYRELHDEEVITYVESRNCYSVMGPLEVPPVGGYYILFGGPGGKCPE